MRAPTISLTLNLPLPSYCPYPCQYFLPLGVDRPRGILEYLSPPLEPKAVAGASLCTQTKTTHTDHVKSGMSGGQKHKTRNFTLRPSCYLLCRRRSANRQQDNNHVYQRGNTNSVSKALLAVQPVGSSVYKLLHMHRFETKVFFPRGLEVRRLLPSCAHPAGSVSSTRTPSRSHHLHSPCIKHNVLSKASNRHGYSSLCCCITFIPLLS